MAQLDSLTRTLKGNKHWLVVRPNNNHLQGTITRVVNTKHKPDILKHLGNFIQDTPDYEIIISAISKILDHYKSMFPEGMPKSYITDLGSLNGLVQHPTNPNNVTIDSFIFARLKRNMINGVVVKAKDGALASYSSTDKQISINVEGIQGSINRNIANNGKYNYNSTDDYVYCEFEKSIIHEFLHSISDNGTQIGFANYKATEQHIGMNEATTEKIATMIASPKNYRKTNLTLLKTKRAQFLTNVDSNSGYSYFGIVNLMGMLTGIEQHNKSLQTGYLLGTDVHAVIKHPSIITNVDTIYKFAKEKNPITQAELYYNDSMNSYYDSIGISSTTKPNIVKTIQITYIDDNKTVHNIPVECYIYPGNIYKYNITNSATITDEMVEGTFDNKHIQNQMAGKSGAKTAVGRFITGYLNTNNISPYSSITVSHFDIQGQPSTWRYLMASKAQDDISSLLFPTLKNDIAALQGNFSTSKFYELLKRVDAIGNNIVYSIPNGLTKYNLKNVGYVSRLITNSNTTLPIQTITQYHDLRKALFTIAKSHESQFTPLNSGKSTIINLDGCDISFDRTAQGYYKLSSKQSNLSALQTKMKKYPLLANISHIDNSYINTVIENIVNNGIAYNELDDFSNKYIEKTQITYQTMCSYIRNEKFKQKDFVLSTDITFAYNGTSIHQLLPIKITTQNTNKLNLTKNTLHTIQNALKTPYALSELNALIAAFVTPKLSANISDFHINCNLENPQFMKDIKDATKDKFIKVGGEVIAIPVFISQDTCIIGANTPNSLDKHIEKYITTTSTHNAVYNILPDKKVLIQTIRSNFNHYIHSCSLNEKLRASTKSKPMSIDIANMVDYIVANSPEVAKIVSQHRQQTKPQPQPQPKKQPVNTPNGNTQTGTNPSGNNISGTNPTGSNTNATQVVSPYDYFKQYIGKNGQFNFTPYTMWPQQTMNPNYYYMMYQQYQFMQYYSYMMNFYGGYQNYPMIQQMNMGNMLMPGSIMYGYMPQMSSPMMMPYVFNGYNNFYGYNSYMQGGFNQNMMPFYQTNTSGQVTTTNISKEQIAALSGMVSNIPANPANTAETVKALQALKAQLDALIAKNATNLQQTQTSKPANPMAAAADEGMIR